MSSTRRGAERVEGDAYQTPKELALFLAEKLVADGFLSNGEPRVLEPSAGDGNFVRALRDRVNPGLLVANELLWTPEREATYGIYRAEAWRKDFGEFTSQPRWSAVVGNPPYAYAEKHIRKGIDIAAKKGGIVAYLLRLAFLESSARVPFWKEHPCRKIYVLSQRPSFVNGKTDSSAYGFFVWMNGSDAKTELEVLSWRDAPPPTAHREYDVERDLARLGEALEELE